MEGRSEKEQFDKWNQEKQDIHFSGRLPTVRNGEIWWCALGKNISVYRLYRKMGKVDDRDFQVVKVSLINLLFE